MSSNAYTLDHLIPHLLRLWKALQRHRPHCLVYFSVRSLIHYCPLRARHLWRLEKVDLQMPAQAMPI